ncbi:MAG: DNA translocase FtsK 4TM domain-containing protein [Chloracidobacterium sp.]|nr:DNA translocase FtsK 4TM domain-containing protein [Chloracidobacterium sp.]
MKVCPTCKESYDDETNFCLADGTTLIKKKGKKQPKHSYVNDVLAIIVGAVALLVLLSLLTSSAADRDWFGFATGNGMATRNWIGPVGVNIAALLFSFFGWASYLLPVLIGLIAWRIFQSDTMMPRPLRVLGFVFFVVSLAGLLSLTFGASAGAIVGEGAAQWTAYFIGKIGAAILLAAVFVSSLLLVTNFTLEGFMGHFDVAWGNLRIRLDDWREKRRAERAPVIDEAKKRADKRRAIREAQADAIPPTINIAEIEAMAAGAAVGRSASFDEGPSIPTIEGERNPYETVTVNEEDAEPIVRKSKGKTTKVAVEPPSIPGQTYDDYVLPDPSMLDPAAAAVAHNEDELRAEAKLLEEKTAEFNVPGKVMHIFPGPVVTTFEFKPDAGVKYSRVTGLVDDLCLALKAPSIRIDRIPGKAYVGIEVPNKKREVIHLRDVVESSQFQQSTSLLTLGLGKTIDGGKYVSDLTKMPHLLIAGATGAGKSVGVNTLVMSVLYKARPDEVKFIMVDPKRLELGLYADIPHLSVPIITDPKRAANALRWAVSEMEKRYKDLAGYGVRNIDGYNTEAKRRNDLEQWDDNGEPHRKLPYIVIIIDELADLMMVAGKDVEESITRLAQMARAVGIHLVLATQRPSVDVITGLIKANFPSRISFRVSSKVDSRTIIDANGAESLLGQGDMLFLPPGNAQVVRVHGAFVHESEIKKVVDHIKQQGNPEYDQTITKSEEEMDDSGDLPGRRDPLFTDALKCVVQAKRGSTSLLQRHLRIGYGRAAAILDAMVREGYIGEMDGSTRARPVLPKAYEDLQDIEEGALGED